MGRKDRIDIKVQCKKCFKEFSGQGLGGHMSRAHPGESKDFQKKLDTRNRREEKRKLLRDAQEIYKQRYNTPNIKGCKMTRKIIEKIKGEIKLDKELPKTKMPLKSKRCRKQK
jgi:hypothetical protein